jgi:hypothetical protein
MAFPVRGTSQAGSAGNGLDVTLTFDAVTPPRTGDIVVVFGGHTHGGTGLGPNTAGYTPIATHSSSSPDFGAWYKVMGATPDTSVVCEGGGAASVGVGYCSFVLDGTLVDASIFDQTTVTVGPTTSTNPNLGAITTQTNGAWVVGMAMSEGNSDATRGTVTNYTDLISITKGGTGTIAVASVYREITTAGSEDPAAWPTWSSGSWFAITTAIKPAAGGPSPISGSGSPVATLSATASGTGSEIFNASGTPMATLSPFSSGTGSEIFNASGAAVATLSPFSSGTGSEIFNASGAPVAALSATAAGSATMTPDAGGPTPVTGSGAAVATLSAFASGTATMTPPGGAPRRKARGYLVYDEPTPKKKKKKRKPVVEAEPLPEIIGIPAVELEHLSRARWAEVLAVPLTPKRARPAPVEVDEDEEDFDDLLEILSMID